MSHNHLKSIPFPLPYFSQWINHPHPTFSRRVIMVLQTSLIASSNFRAIFVDHPSQNEAIKLMIKFLPSHPMFRAFESFKEVVPLSVLFKCTFSVFRPSHNLQEVHLNLVDDFVVVLSKEKSLNAINLRVLPTMKFYSPSTNDVFSTLYQMGYQKKLRGVIEFKKNQLLVVWKFMCHFVIRCL